jgi:hypothetical protein
MGAFQPDPVGGAGNKKGGLFGARDNLNSGMPITASFNMPPTLICPAFK